MSFENGRDAQMSAIWADQQAMEIVLRAMIKAGPPEARREMLVRIKAEADRFTAMSNDPSLNKAVLAVVASLIDDLSDPVLDRASA